MKERAPQTTASLECPELKKHCDVSLELNVFRGANHGGLQVTGCSEFLNNKNALTCGKDCIHTPEAQQAHEQEIRNHQHELSKIGPNVIG